MFQQNDVNAITKPEIMRSFFKALFQNPRAMGAVLPSSPYLAHRMATCIDATKPGFVLELGPGTGAITQAILSSGVPPEKLIALELGSDLATKLQKQFPGVTVIQGSAVNLSYLLKQFGPIHTIVSSLPLRSLSKSDRAAILSEIPKILGHQGQFIQFTYTLKDSADFYPKAFLTKKTFYVLRNIPPARVTIFDVV